MGDVSAGLRDGDQDRHPFVAERGAGVEIRTTAGDDGPGPPQRQPRRRPHVLDLGFRGRPAGPLVTVLGELIDASSVGGAVFDLGSAAFDLTRIVTGQLDAYLDVGSRMIDEARPCGRSSSTSAAARC